MTGKFADMLPLTDEQREFLSDDDNEKNCTECFLSSLVRGGYVSCGEFVRGNKNGFFCHEIRAEALRIDDEYRMGNMKSDILSHEEFKELLRGADGPVSVHTPAEYRILKSHAALLDRVAELEKQLSDNTAGIEINVTAKRYRLCEGDDWTIISEGNLNIDNPIGPPIDFDDFIYNDKLHVEKDELLRMWGINQYDKKPKRMDTRDEAGKKCSVWQAKMMVDGHIVSAFMTRDAFIAAANNKTVSFPYAAPREPQKGDLMQFKNEGCDAHVFQLRAVFKDSMLSKPGFYYDIKHCKPTGYRWDTETGTIVKIEER